VSVGFGAREAALLRDMVSDLDTLVSSIDRPGDGETASDGDPLAAALGIGTSTRAPSDPALARLFPDGYIDDDEGSADFRRYTQPGLRDARRARIAVVLDTMPGRQRRVLSTAEAEAWLGVLADLRLVLGERLEATEDVDALIAGLEDDDPRRGTLVVYDWLGWVQETLVRALS
jgi:hypothetical protein